MKKKNFGKQVSVEHCHGCNKNMRISLDLNLNGQHEIKCPNCGHPHYRQIENGKITQGRYDPNHQGPTYFVTAAYVSYSSATCTSTDTACSGLWQSSTDYSTGGW